MPDRPYDAIQDLIYDIQNVWLRIAAKVNKLVLEKTQVGEIPEITGLCFWDYVMKIYITNIHHGIVE